jgi:hypothetical protein
LLPALLAMIEFLTVTASGALKFLIPPPSRAEFPLIVTFVNVVLPGPKRKNPPPAVPGPDAAFPLIVVFVMVATLPAKLDTPELPWLVAMLPLTALFVIVR